ncbi:phage head closure protein [Neptuniibacter pectenicola]|uniref:phage head closure protein n=1 Tax=Neptuniibacter pectenicola TaxID=1806669 RepID=UPI0007933DC8|nr:phage head closure protein [Neptuniibacter pectenicola]KXJ57185.1 MAG: hypothetical protein AXW15_13700 [Neptuniibacter sp. Phe_28]
MRYPHRITIQTKNTGKTSTGVPDDTPVVVLDGIYARVSVITGREKWVPEASEQSNDVTVICRYRTGITEAMQIKHGDSIYQITAIIPDERNTELRCICKRYQDRG